MKLTKLWRLRGVGLGIVLSTVFLLSAAAVWAQRDNWGGGWGRGGDWRNVGRRGVPSWEIDPNFRDDTFTFARVKYDSGGYRDKWRTDFPDSDLNFSLRLQQLTSLKVNPDPVVVELTDPKLFNYPFLYLIEPGQIMLSEAEVVALRRYLLNGGFLMIDDFWGDEEYWALERAMQRVFPNRSATEVPLSHEIFNCVYPLTEKPQVPSIHAAARYGYNGEVQTWEYRPGSDTSRAIYRAIYDDKDRIMVFICHNTDLGDGWEREGENKWYFEEFSVKKAYPMGINIVTYAMTH
jgi:hypothetical protein